ncbi:MAG: TlpA disulfide reductase family protein [Bacteroidota bacterium]
MKRFFSILLVCFIVELATGQIRHLSLEWGFVASFIIFFFTLQYFFYRYPADKQKTLVCFLVAPLLLHGTVWAIDRAMPNVGFPNIIGDVISCIASYVFTFTRSRILKAATLTIAACICIWYAAIGCTWWLSYINYGTINGRVQQKLPELQGLNIQHEFKDDNKLVILDFFSTSCGICFSEFPALQQLYEQKNRDTNIVIYAIDVPLKRDTPGMALNMVRRRKYTFPVAVASPGVDSALSIVGYPTVLIIKNREIIYRGDIYGVSKVIGN